MDDESTIRCETCGAFYLAVRGDDCPFCIDRELAALRARVARLEEALLPFAAIADQADMSGLDEWRPDWEKYQDRRPEVIELYTGRGGGRLMTLADVYAARAALRD